MTLAALGRPALIAALIFALGAAVLAAAGAIRSRRDLTDAATRSLAITAGFVVTAAVALTAALLAHDFSYSYVASYSSRSLTGPYALAALWGGMEGSLLFWTLLLTLFAVVAVVRARAKGMAHPVTAWATAVLAVIAAFFLILLIAPANPFTKLLTVPADGRGLNPLLQSPAMLIHPPLLYTGFVGFSIPFAFAMGALLSRRLDDTWFTSTRRWTLFAWSALSIGIVLGGAWAYTELGWGGYWAWDPVENASFMPWLTATAYLHSVVIQEKRRMFKVWNVCLILITYALAVFGTFLTRSGILSSIHTFTEGPIGRWFLPFLALMLIGGVGIVLWRLDGLRSTNRFDSLLSRESAFLANNVLFLAAASTVLWGTLYPVVAEAFSGARLSVGPPFFDAVFIPLGLALMALAGIGPLIGWRSMSTKAFGRIIQGPLVAGVVTIVACVAIGVRSVGALLAFGICAFTVASIVGEFVRGSRVHRKREALSWGPALVRTLTRNRRRYGGYVVHLGVVLIVIGLAGSAFRTERQASLDEGQSMDIAGYQLVYRDLETSNTPEKQVFQTDIDVSRDGEHVTTLHPQRNFHVAQQQWQSEIAIRSTPIEDLYIVVTTIDPDGAASVRAFVNPLTWWIWAGAVVMLLGMGVILSGRLPVAGMASTRTRVAEPVAATR
ncbi:MAG TPA: heme lyase CcmF/NrfE family subunit [Actinomycetota bacterium]|nr:heme lyase CcmF/NrfE family subunit [Actinomycetota bacterium]